MTTLLSQGVIHIKNIDTVRQKIRKLLLDGPESLYVISDFDATISHPDGPSSWSVFELSPLLSEDYRNENEETVGIYYPISVDPDLSQEEKTQAMVEWTEMSFSSIIRENITKPLFNTILDQSMADFRLRNGCDAFFKFTHKNKIPLLVFSAGIADIIEGIFQRMGLVQFHTERHEAHILSDALLGVEESEVQETLLQLGKDLDCDTKTVSESCSNIHVIGNRFFFLPTQPYLQRTKAIEEVMLKKQQVLSTTMTGDRKNDVEVVEIVEDVTEMTVQCSLSSSALDIQTDQTEEITSPTKPFDFVYHEKAIEKGHQHSCHFIQHHLSPKSAKTGDEVVGILDADANADADHEEYIVGLLGRAVHVFNKNSSLVKGSHFEKQVIQRKNVIILGDNTGDADMATGSPLDTILTIGYYNVTHKACEPHLLAEEGFGGKEQDNHRDGDGDGHGQGDIEKSTFSFVDADEKTKSRIRNHEDIFDIVLIDDRSMYYVQQLLTDIIHVGTILRQQYGTCASIPEDVLAPIIDKFLQFSSI